MSSETTPTTGLAAADHAESSTDADTHSLHHPVAAGSSIGRRERAHGNLRAITEIAVERVLEEIADLAVADRVAFVLARRTGTTHAVIACPTTYLVVALQTTVAPHEAWTIVQTPSEPPLASIANPEGVTPILRGIDIDLRLPI